MEVPSPTFSCSEYVFNWLAPDSSSSPIGGFLLEALVSLLWSFVFIFFIFYFWG